MPPYLNVGRRGSVEGNVGERRISADCLASFGNREERSKHGYDRKVRPDVGKRRQCQHSLSCLGLLSNIEEPARVLTVMLMVPSAARAPVSV